MQVPRTNLMRRHRGKQGTSETRDTQTHTDRDTYIERETERERGKDGAKETKKPKSKRAYGYAYTLG